MVLASTLGCWALGSSHAGELPAGGQLLHGEAPCTCCWGPQLTAIQPQRPLAAPPALLPQVHSHGTDASGEVELPASPDVPLLGGGSGGSSGGKREGPRHRPHSGAAAAAGAGGAEHEAAEGGGSPGPQQPRAGGGRRQSLAELWEGALFVLSSRGWAGGVCQRTAWRQCVAPVGQLQGLGHATMRLPPSLLRVVPPPPMQLLEIHHYVPLYG